jgi:hypothetical protein
MLGAMLVWVVVGGDASLQEPSPWGAQYAGWVVGSCFALLLAHLIAFGIAFRKAYRNQLDQTPLVRVFRRSPWLLWLDAVILLAPYPYQTGVSPLATSLIAAVLALLTHLAVRASLRVAPTQQPPEA